MASKAKKSSLPIVCTIGKDGEKYYFRNGRRISETQAAAGKIKRCKRSKQSNMKVGKSKAAAPKKAKAASKSTKRRSSSSSQKSNIIMVKNPRNEEELIFIENPIVEPKKKMSPKRSSPPKKALELQDLLNGKQPSARSSRSSRGSAKNDDLIIFEDVPGPLPRPNFGKPPSPPRALNFLGLPLGNVGAALGVNSISKASPKKANSAAKSRRASMNDKMSAYMHESAAVWQLLPFTDVKTGKIILAPSKRVDIIDRKQLNDAEYRRTLYRRHSAVPGSLVWVPKYIDETLGAYQRDFKSEAMRAYAAYNDKEIMKNIHVLRP